MSAPGVTVVYLTHRPISRFDWFADALAHQLDRADGAAATSDLEVLVVDGLHDAARASAIATAVAGRFPCRAVPSKPTPFNGPHRLTRTEYFAAASARNTGLIHAQHAYVVFVDDLSVPMDGWWGEVARAAREGCVIAGAYQKRRDMVVDRGELVGSRVESAGIDSRWPLGRDDDWVPIAGGQLFGCSFGAPRDLLLSINGCDELCDSIGGEDWQLGWRLEWAGASLVYSRRMLTIESEELHQQPNGLTRRDPLLSSRAYERRLREFGVTRRSSSGAHDSSHMIVDLLFGTKCTQPLGNYYALDEREAGPVSDVSGADGTWQMAMLARMPSRFPRTHWFDGRPLSAL
jgi:hypothetical protein